MDLSLVSLELGACLLGIVVLLVDLWTPAKLSLIHISEPTRPY